MPHVQPTSTTDDENTHGEQQQGQELSELGAVANVSVMGEDPYQRNQRQEATGTPRLP